MTRGYIRPEVYGVRTHLSEWSNTVACRLPVRPYGPKAPTGLTAVPGLECISLSWTPPTETAISEPLGLGALAGYRVHYSTSSPVTSSDPSVWVNADHYIFQETEFPDPPERYFAVVAVDVSGNGSELSNEVSGQAKDVSDTPTRPDVDDHVANATAIVGKGRIFLRFAIPKHAWLRFSHYNVYGMVNSGSGWPETWTLLASTTVGFMHSPLDETYQYRYKVTVVAEDGTETEGTTHGDYTPDEDDQGALLADVVAAQHIISSGDIIGRTLYGGRLRSVTLTTAVGSDFDLDSGTFILGGTSAPKLSWDGTNLAISGSLTATSGTIGGWTIGAAALTAGSGGSSVGLAPGTFPFYAGHATPESAPFRVTSAGALTATSATITGSITVTGGAVPYTHVTGGPASDADNTKTVIDGGLITTGTLELRGGDATTKAGITGEGTGDSQIRLWAGDTYANRGTAAFRVTQGGTLYATGAEISGKLTTGAGSTINADYISTGTIEAVKFITAESETGNKRIEMSVSGGDAHRLLCYGTAAEYATMVDAYEIRINSSEYTGSPRVTLTDTASTISSSLKIEHYSGASGYTVLNVRGYMDLEHQTISDHTPVARDDGEYMTVKVNGSWYWIKLYRESV